MDVKLSKAQASFFKETGVRQLAAVSGLGSGKSFVLMLSFIVNEILAYPDALHCFAALSNQQLTDASLPMFEAMCDDMGITYECNKSSKTYTVNGHTKVMFRSLDTANRMRSVEIGSLYIEEMSYADKDDVNTFIGRLRDSKGSMRLRTVFTPNGFNWCYDFWIKGGTENRRTVRMSTYDNRHLPQEYIDTLEDTYDREMQKQELSGEFLNIGSEQTYYMFSRNDAVRDFTPTQQPTNFGIDFNVNPLCGVAAYQERGVIYVVSEMHLKNSNTFEATKWMVDNLPEDTFVIPDSTGNARKTSSSKTDHQIIKDAGFEVARQRNPYVKDRYNCVNNLLDKGRLVIHSSCNFLIKDLEQMSSNNKDPMISHISDALGYLCWHLAPLKSERKQSRTLIL